MNTIITTELQMMINKHISHFSHYVQYDSTNATYKLDNLLKYFNNLDRITRYPEDLLNQDLYNLAFMSYMKIRDFFMLIGLYENEIFGDGALGQLYKRAVQWLSSPAVSSYRTTTNDVWEYIAPVVPDQLTEVELGIFEAVWWFPVPQMDIEILQRTEGIEMMHMSPTSIKSINGKALYFAVLPDTLNSENSQMD